MVQFGFFDLLDHIRRLSKTGDPLEEMDRIIDCEAFWPVLERALCCSDGSYSKSLTARSEVPNIWPWTGK